jgi:hypothetical protein
MANQVLALPLSIEFLTVKGGLAPKWEVFASEDQIVDSDIIAYPSPTDGHCST